MIPQDKEAYRHVYGGLKVCEYLVRGRESQREAIANCDIILSTYHTIASESSKSTSPLFQINWFRVVLDEGTFCSLAALRPINLNFSSLAHTIRTSSTQLFQAVKKLSAKLRWCVTGTPVQNGLEDLGSLVAFLKVPMLDTPPEFKRHIIDPLVRVNGSGSSNLRALLDSICLRRLNKLLDLPDVDQIWQNIQFSDAEREQYDAAETQMSNEVMLQENLQRSSSSYFSILELEMRPRRLCNHGTFELPLSKMANVQEPFKEASSTTCDSCQTNLSSNILVNNLCNGHHTSCGHLICSGCLIRFEEALAIAKDSDSRICPLCGKQLGGDYLLLDGPEVIPGTNSKESTAYFQPGGISTKINALLANIEESKATDKRFGSTLLIKRPCNLRLTCYSIIFSGWTRTLDLIEHHLTDRNVLFRRIDGSSSLSLRSKILNEFRKNSQIRILMMTTGTGAVGYAYLSYWFSPSTYLIIYLLNCQLPGRILQLQVASTSSSLSGILWLNRKPLRVSSGLAKRKKSL